MRNLFNLDSPIMQKLSTLATLIMAGVIWLICCIPIVTIGASTTAMYRMMFNLREDKSTSLTDFFRAFIENFKNSTLLWLIYILGAAALYGLLRLITLADISNLVRLLFLPPFSLIFFVWFFSLHYCFALSAYFENNLKNTLRNAILISLSHPLQTVICTVLTLLPIISALISVYWLLALGYVWIFIYPGLSFYWKSGRLSKAFSNHLPKEEPDDSDSANS